MVFTSSHTLRYTPMQSICTPVSPVVQGHSDPWSPVQVLALRPSHTYMHTGSAAPDPEKQNLMRRPDRLQSSGTGHNDTSVLTSNLFVHIFYSFFSLFFHTLSSPNHHNPSLFQPLILPLNIPLYPFP